MSATEEKRLFGEQREETVAYLATGQGVATVRVSGDQIGRFGLARRCRARDVAAVGDDVLVATDDDVLVGREEFDSLDFGGAVAVGGGDAPLAADEKGWVSRYRDGEWSVVGDVDEVRAMDGDLVAADDGVYRVAEDDLAFVGLDDVRDVAAAGVPLAAAADGLYRLGNGWLEQLSGDFRTVAAGGDRAHAATADALYAGIGDTAPTWERVALPVDEPVADVGYGECVYAVTGSGAFLVDADPETTPDGAGGWRTRSLGLADVAAMAVL